MESNTPSRVCGTYRKYNRDASIPVPRSTFWQHRRRLMFERSRCMCPVRTHPLSQICFSNSPPDTETATDDQESDTTFSSPAADTSPASCTTSTFSSVNQLSTSPLIANCKVASSKSDSSSLSHVSVDSSDTQCVASSPVSSSSGLHYEETRYTVWRETLVGGKFSELSSKPLLAK